MKTMLSLVAAAAVACLFCTTTEAAKPEKRTLAPLVVTVTPNAELAEGRVQVGVQEFLKLALGGIIQPHPAIRDVPFPRQIGFVLQKRHALDQPAFEPGQLDGSI